MIDYKILLEKYISLLDEDVGDPIHTVEYGDLKGKLTEEESSELFRIWRELP